MDSSREGRTIKADRRARIVVIAACAGTALLGLMLMVLVIPWGQDYLEGQEPDVTLRVAQAATALVFLSLLPASGYVFWVGRQAVRSRQMPPPGARVIRDTRVVEGDRAVMQGRAMMAMAIILFAVSLFAGIWLPVKLGRAFAARPQGPEVSEPAMQETPAANDVTPRGSPRAANEGMLHCVIRAKAGVARSDAVETQDLASPHICPYGHTTNEVDSRPRSGRGQAGIHVPVGRYWTPACAGVTSTGHI